MAITAGYQVFLRNHQKLWLWRSGAAEFFRFFEDKISLQPWVGSLKFLTFSEMVGTEPATWITWIGVHAFPPWIAWREHTRTIPMGPPTSPVASRRFGAEHTGESWEETMAATAGSPQWGGEFWMDNSPKPWENHGKKPTKLLETIGNSWICSFTEGSFLGFELGRSAKMVDWRHDITV